MKKHFFVKSPLQLIGLIAGLLGIGMILLAIFWNEPQNPNINVSDETQQIFQVTTAIGYDSTQTPPVNNLVTTPAIQDGLIHTPTPEWMTYDGIDFRDKEMEVLITMKCNQDTVYFEPFRVVPYSPDATQNREFYENMDFSIAWEHLDFYMLWVHSGLAYRIGELTAYPLQIYIEKDARGFFRNPSEVDQHLKDCVINAEMRLHQGNTISVNKVVAAVRVPPSEVDEVSRRASDLVPYLAETYPDSGFDQMEPPGLVFYFCGQQLTGEMANPNYNSWTQARFIIGFMPVTSD